MGGVVKHFGKPHNPIFETAIQTSLDHYNHNKKKLITNDNDSSSSSNNNNNNNNMMTSRSISDLLRVGMSEKLQQSLLRRQRLRVLHIGDSLHHDILG